MNKEILMVVDAVSTEKDVAKSVIFEAIEAALASATKKRNREDIEVRVSIDRETGDYETYRCWEIMPDGDEILEAPTRQIFLNDAHEKLKQSEMSADIEVGEFLEEPMESVEFGRIAAQAAKQVIVQKVREAERAQVVEKYRSVLGELVNGTVKKVTREFLIIDLGDGAEAILSRNELIPGEVFRIGDRLRAVLQEEERENRGPQLALSRRCLEILEREQKYKFTEL